MIKNLHIQNYRSIRDMSLELEQLNIVFGPNGTGCTARLRGNSPKRWQTRGGF